MYTSNQQRCLLELGIQPLVLRERGASGQPDVAPLSDMNPPKVSSLQQMAKPDHRPSLASLLKTTPDKRENVASEQARKTDEYDWQDQAPKVVQDLSAFFPTLQANGNELILSESKIWCIQPDSTDIQITGERLISAPVTHLSKRQKAQIWAWMCNRGSQ